MIYTEEKFNSLLDRLMIEKGYKPFPFILYDEDGKKDSIVFFKFIKSYNRKGEEYVVFAEVFGDLKSWTDSEYNARIDETKCPVAELEETLSRFLDRDSYRFYAQMVERETFVKEQSNIILSKFIEKRINVPTDLKLLIEYAISEAYKKGDAYRFYQMYRGMNFFRNRNEFIDFSEYIKE